MRTAPFNDLDDLAQYLRHELENKKFLLLHAHNGTGKTRLSTAFKNLGKVEAVDGEHKQRDTLYFNAFTEDLFTWDNDLENDNERKLKLNADSSFFAGLESMEMDNRIREQLDRYADFEFKINFEIDDRTGKIREADVIFSRTILTGEGDAARAEDAVGIKISRGEENIFIWCFFLAVVRLALDDDGSGPYNWVSNIYIDDPISSLDDHNAIAVANHLAKMLTESNTDIRTIVSTHHVLFFNVLCNELKSKAAHRGFLSRSKEPGALEIRDVGNIPVFAHLVNLVELHELQQSGDLFTHHFNMLRRVFEQTAGFFGYEAWHDCIRPSEDDPDRTLYKRIIDLMSHGDYSLYEPREMMQENKNLFWTIFNDFRLAFPFNPDLFPEDGYETETP